MDATNGSEWRPRGRPPGAARMWARPVAWISLVAVAFALNIGWEYGQFPLYAAHTLPTWIFVKASATDAVLIALASGLALFVRRRRPVGFWVVLVATLAAVAAAIEAHAQLTGRWAYGADMPMIGPLGLTPLLQLPVLGALTNACVRPWRAHRYPPVVAAFQQQGAKRSRRPTRRVNG